ncbi:septum formation protein Maf [Clostridium homopropionicum DSM 5847]|uniref:dTTP/UTP pyrophosphatase n=1 Tax=Clostridium homopropionicum DSM 5847 TaxID=1121318 RepID=A0A0L6ZBJ1_9CLOT|nr:Maf-like protein [Clostridium homopropionicum]KOA20168.1 septum formation protein Maf [Clostridium homopropionicum DSM 5847]SFG60567.1 septum formation protein [Clostridium homopropionicum]
MTLVLASASERRKELLTRLTEEFNIIISDFDESKVIFNEDCSKYVMDLAEGKARSVAKDLKYDALIIGCDTVVTYNDEVLGKPKNEEDAFEMLKRLSGKIHKVYSGIAIFDTIKCRVIRDCACTEVKFSDITDEEILKYVSSGEPMDKAGAYGIQGFGGVFVEYIKGDFYNVVGLPINKLKYMLRVMGVNL